MNSPQCPQHVEVWDGNHNCSSSVNHHKIPASIRRFLLGSRRIRCKHHIDILVPCLLHINMSSGYRVTLAFIQSCFSHLTNLASPTFNLFFALFWSPPASEGNIWFLHCYCRCLTFFNPVVANFVCPLLQAQQSTLGLPELCCWKQLSSAAWNKVDERVKTERKQ